MGQKVTFKNSKGDRLVGIFSGSTDTTSPIVILCHGSTTSKNSSSLVKLAEILDKNNISTFRFDFFGHGESAGNFEDITISEILDDVDRAIVYLQEKGYKKIALMGSSFGATAVILAAQKHPEIFALALKSPVVDPKRFDELKRSTEEFENWKKTGKTTYDPTDPKKTKINYTFFEDYQKYDGFKSASNIKRPVIIVHGGSDPEVPVSDSITVSQVFPNCQLKVINGADHRYTKPEDFSLMLKFLSDFIIKHSRLS